MTDGRVLVLDFNGSTRIATCFDKTTKGLIKIRVDMETEPHPGEFIQYIKNAPVRNGFVVANSLNAQIISAQPEDCVKIEDGQLKISAWVGFSDKPHHKTYDRNLAFGDWYGLIDNSQFRQKAIQLEEQTGKRLFASFIVVNDLNYVNNNSQLFKVAKFKYAVLGKEKNKEVNDILRNLDVFEETLAAMDGRESPIRSSTPSSSSTPQSSDLLCRMGIAMTVAMNYDLIIWMCDLNAVAVLERACPNAYSIRLGSVFECFVQKQGFCFNVTEVRRMLEIQVPFRVHELKDGSFEAEFAVDVCTPNFKFNFWTIYTGIAVLNSEHVGMVTTADKVFFE